MSNSKGTPGEALEALVSELDIIEAKLEVDKHCDCPDCRDKRWLVKTLRASLLAQPRETIPENILRAADAIAAYPEAYQGYPLILAKYLRDNWPSLPATPPTDRKDSQP